MNHRNLTALAVLIAWWGIGENVAHAQVWRLGTFGLPSSQRTASGPYRQSITPNAGINTVQPGMSYIQPDGSYAPGLVGPGAVLQQPVLQTGHPVTVFNYQQYFPLGYGTSSGTNISTGGITGIGGVNGLGQGTTGIQQQGFYSGSSGGLNTLNLNTPQRGRTGGTR